MTVARPVRPTASTPLDGAAPVEQRQHPWSSHRVRALPFAEAWPRGNGAAIARTASTMRIQAAGAADTGFVVGTLNAILGVSLD